MQGKLHWWLCGAWCCSFPRDRCGGLSAAVEGVIWRENGIEAEVVVCGVILAATHKAAIWGLLARLVGRSAVVV